MVGTEGLACELTTVGPAPCPPATVRPCPWNDPPGPLRSSEVPCTAPALFALLNSEATRSSSSSLCTPTRPAEGQVKVNSAA